MRNNNPDRTPDILDLFYILKKRHVSLEEWLDYHSINSIKDFHEKGEEIAMAQGCYISDEMREVAIPLVQVRAEIEYKKILDISKSFSKVEDTSKPLETIKVSRETKKKTSDRKNGSNDEQSEVRLNLTIDPEMDKEILKNEDKNS